MNTDKEKIKSMKSEIKVLESKIKKLNKLAHNMRGCQILSEDIWKIIGE